MTPDQARAARAVYEARWRLTGTPPCPAWDDLTAGERHLWRQVAEAGIAEMLTAQAALEARIAAAERFCRAAAARTRLRAVRLAARLVLDCLAATPAPAEEQTL